MSLLKKCACCQEEYSLNVFNKNCQQKDGYSCYCIFCTKDKNKEKYILNSQSHVWKLTQTLRASKERARRKNIENTLTLEELISIYPEDNFCPILGIKLSWGFPKESSPSLDRIDNTKGYFLENCQIISNRANELKSDASLQELELLVNYLKENYLV